MKEENQHQWEKWASQFHENEGKPDNNIQRDADKKDFEVVQRVFRLKDRVRQALSLGSADSAWTVVSARLAHKSRRNEYLRYAAVLLISLLLSGSALWTVDRLNFDSQEYASINSPKGQITNITLFDGTNIWLNAGSSIQYSRAFNSKNRKVVLDGEALFSVTKNKKLPFIVKAGEAQIKVYGTEFNVKAYANDSEIEAVLLEGKVEFITQTGSVVMSPGELLSFSKQDRQIQKQNVNPEEYTTWKGGKIYYDNEKLVNIVMQLERWYEVKFKFSDEKIKSYRFTGVINKSKSLDYVLNLIQEINKVKFEFKNEQILITE